MTEGTKTITISATWKSTHTVEVPVGYEPTGGIDDEWADQVTSEVASLVDWEIR